MHGKGTILLSCASGDSYRDQIAQRLLYAPDLTANLISASVLKKNFDVQFSKDGCTVSHGDKIYLTGTLRDGLFQLNCEKMQEAFMVHQRKLLPESKKNQLDWLSILKLHSFIFIIFLLSFIFLILISAFRDKVSCLLAGETFNSFL